jgi:hypothetical protein
MLYIEYTPICITTEQVREAIYLLMELDIADEIYYEVRTCEVIGNYKVWFISIKKMFIHTVDVNELLEVIKEQGYYTVYTNRYWRISVL